MHEASPNSWQKTRSFESLSFSLDVRSNDLSSKRPIGCSWCSWQEQFEPGSKLCSSSRKTTLLRWHRQGFRLYWKYKSRAASSKPKISAETVALIEEMARENRLWGAERIRGELRKLGFHVCKRTIQKHMRHVRTTRPRGRDAVSQRCAGSTTAKGRHRFGRRTEAPHP